MLRPPAITSVSALLALREALSLTCTVNPKFPELVGVPLIVPLPAFKLRPAGRLPLVTDQL
jgi:hypothetical protein